MKQKYPRPTFPKFHYLRWSYLSLGLVLIIITLPACENKVEKLIQTANEEWVKGQNQSAVEIFKSILNDYPSDPYAEEALFRLGEIYDFSLNNNAKALVYFQEAIIEYQKLINNFDNEDEKGDHQYRIAIIYYKKENYEQAITELEILLEKFPGNQWAEETAYRLTNIQYSLGRCDKAREQYDRFIILYPESKFRSEVDFVMASCLEEEGKLVEALKKFKGLKDSYSYPSLLENKLAGLKRRIEKKRR
ncbi:MAG: outer membrane protein assembly factor BamD [Nitrospinales bacterium]